MITRPELEAVATAALAWNRARLVRIEIAKRVPDWPHPLHHRASAALGKARQFEAKAKAALRKACAVADPAPLTIDAELVPQKAIGHCSEC